MASRTLEVQIIGDSKSLENALGKSSKTAESSFSKMGKASLVAGAAITGGVVVALGSSVKAAQEAQKVQAQTEAQLKALGISYKAHASQIEDVIASTSKLAAVDDEELQESFTRLLPATKNVGEALEGMQLAADVARARNISLASATNIVAKANLGSATALKKLGINMTATHSAVDKLKATHDKFTAGQLAAAKETDRNAQAQANLSTLQKTFAGSAEAYGQSAAGAQDRMRVAVENLQESLGTMLLPMVERVANAMARLAAFFSEHETLTKALVLAIGALGALLLTVGVGMKIVAASQGLAAAATATWTAAQWLLNAALTANPIGIVVVAIAALVAGIILAWKHSETFRNVVTGAFNAVKAAAMAVLNFFRDNWKIIAVLISGPFAPLVALATNAFGIRSALVSAASAVIDFFRTHWKTIAVLISGPFAPLVALATDAFGVRSAMVHAFNAIRNAVVGALEEIIDTFRWLANNAGVLAKKILTGLTAPIEAVISLFERLFRIIDAVRGAVKNVLDQIANIKIPSLPSLPGIPGFAEGVKNFKGGYAVVGENGPELVTLPRGANVIPSAGMAMRGGSNGGQPIVVNVYNAGSVTSERDLVTMIRNALIQDGRRNGGDILGGYG